MAWMIREIDERTFEIKYEGEGVKYPLVMTVREKRRLPIFRLRWRVAHEFFDVGLSGGTFYDHKMWFAERDQAIAYAKETSRRVGLAEDFPAWKPL